MEEVQHTPEKVALFSTCVVDQLLPEVGVATTRLLRQQGFVVEFPAEQTCCGQPFFNSGFQPEALKLVKHTIEVLEGYPAVVVPGGSCTVMIRKEYPHLLADDVVWLERAQALAAKTFELSEFLTKYATLVPGKSTLGVSYHDSCHMCRTLGIKEQPRQLLRQAGCELVEMQESDRCCGFGGLFSLRMPEVSGAMTREKLEQAVRTGVDVLVTADPGCLMQMRGLLGDGQSLRVEHLAVVLEEFTR